MANDVFEKIVEAPAVALEKTVDGSKKISEEMNDKLGIKGARRYWRTLGPGLTTGAADDDPAGITTYSQAGAAFGYQLLWLAPLTFPLMAVVQEMCARIGMVTGRGLSSNIRIHYPRPILYACAILLLIANTINIGANLGAMAKATQLILPHFSFPILLIFFTVVSLLLQIFVSYKHYSGYLKWLALILLSYVVAGFTLKLDWALIIGYTFIPSLTLNVEHVFLICAILGTTISPYLFFWQTSQEVEESIMGGNTSLRLRQELISKKEITHMRLDVWSGMFLSNIVMFFIIVICATTLNANGILNITTAEQAASALRPFAGDYAYLLFTLGIIGTGMLAVPVLAGSSSYALSESFGWKFGLYRKLKQAHAFYGVLIIAMGIGFLLNFIGLGTIQALILSAIINGLIAPLILFLIIQLSSSEKIMGKWRNNLLTSFFGWIICILMSIVAIWTAVGFFFQP